MKRFVVVMIGTLAFISIGTRFTAAQERTFTGLITDEQLNCIQNPMKVPEQSAKGAPPWGKDACVLYWTHYANPKEKVVLYDPDAKATFFVDDENAVMPYVGDTQKVRVSGTLNEVTKTIHVTHVQS